MKLLDLRHGIDDFFRHSIRKKFRFRILIQTCNTSASADLRALNVTQLAELDKTLVIRDNDEPLAALLKYEHFLAMQEMISDEEK
jgi:hypothetical protein